MLVKTIRIASITKSYKYDGYVMVRSIKGKEYKRKHYPKATGKYAGRSTVYFEDEMYSFKWVGQQGVDIKWEKSVVTQDGAEDEVEEIDQPEIDAEWSEVEVPAAVEEKEDGPVKHEKYEQIKICVENEIPVFLVGPAGSGKNHVLEQIAKEMGLDFYFTNSVQQEFKLTGFIDAGGKYHDTEFYKAFSNGGLFFLDEMDASIPEVLVLLNAAIANGYFEFPNGKINAHDNFRIVSAGNTVGNGADDQYTGRLVLDQATLDRFAIIEFDYSEKIELHLAKGNKNLVAFIRSLREEAKKKGVRATFSYRCITMVVKLEGKVKTTDILLMAVFKGLDKDTINTFNLSGLSQYHQALKAVQA